MKLADLLSEIKKTQIEIGASEPYICGGTPRDKVMKNIKNISDLDITTGDKTIDYLGQKFYDNLSKNFSISKKLMPDGHTTIFFGNLKMDFSSNFNIPNIDVFLNKIGIANPSDMQREVYSRDFTCNCLLMSLDMKNILDVTKNGLNDIKNKKIKTCLPPEVTLITNKNRVARAIYLAAKLDFDLDNSIIEYVKKYPETMKISSNGVLVEKLNESFTKDGDKTSYYLTKMGLWNLIPVNEIAYPYYIKHVKKRPNVAK